jgi:ABC-type histidine transport system ATPase subunit
MCRRIFMSVTYIEKYFKNPKSIGMMILVFTEMNFSSVNHVLSQVIVDHQGTLEECQG